MSPNPEIGVRARSGEARECLRQEIQEIALNPITSETPGGDVYETFRGEGGGDIGEKRSFSKPLYRFLMELRALRYFEPSDGYRGARRGKL